MDVNAEFRERHRRWIVKRLVRLEQLRQGFDREFEALEKDAGPLDLMEQRAYRSAVADMRIALWNAKTLLQEAAERLRKVEAVERKKR